MQHIRQQRGFALIASLFIIVVLVLIGAYMLTLSNVQHGTSALSVQSTRAYFAARSGMEWAIYQAINNHDTVCSTGPATTTNLNINGFNVTVVCDDLSAGGFQETSSTYGMNDIQVTAQRGSDTTFWGTSRRSLRAMVQSPTP